MKIKGLYYQRTYQGAVNVLQHANGRVVYVWYILGNCMPSDVPQQDFLGYYTKAEPGMYYYCDTSDIQNLLHIISLTNNVYDMKEVESLLKY